jgi:hypothetical protein
LDFHINHLGLGPSPLRFARAGRRRETGSTEPP